MLFPQSATPGVHWEQHFSPPVPESLTGVPALLGFASRGEIAQPQRLTLWTQFAPMFGSEVTGCLPYAVQGFFGNGGRVCYVVRLRPDVSIDDALTEGLQTLTTLEAIDLICAPDLAASSQDSAHLLQLQAAILTHCEAMGDRFAILDAKDRSTVDQVQQDQQQLSLHEASRSGALYFPWIQVQRLSDDRDFAKPPSPMRLVPPCGHIAGIYAQSDSEVGVHKAPANDVLNGVVDLSVDLSNLDQVTLNPDWQAAGVNCLRVLPGRGIRVWGARTLSQEMIWRYVNVRRLFLMVARWIDRNLTNFAFEPNDLMLWIRIERELTAYLESLLAQGALQGNAPQEAFYIKCDAETNPLEVRDRGIVITEIGLAPTVPSEFIVVRLIQGETGVTLA